MYSTIKPKMLQDIKYQEKRKFEAVEIKILSGSEACFAVNALCGCRRTARLLAIIENNHHAAIGGEL